MAQNQAHISDTVAVNVGELKGRQGTIVALRKNENRCMVRIAAEDDPNDYLDYVYDGAELKLIDCYHMGVITSE